MSIFKDIKGTIQSVQQDISTSIKSLASSSKDSSKRSNVRTKSQNSRSDGVNLDAGGDLLYRYQESWSDLHQQAEENASKAENLAVVIGSLYVKIDHQSENISRFSEEAKGLPTILQQLQELTNQIACVEELCEQVEAAEVQLENVCECEEFRQAQTKHLRQLAVYRERKQAAAHTLKVGLAEQHARTMKVRDSKRQSQLKERQCIFQEAFDKDINYYRTFGKTERQPSVERDTTASLDLADIKIEDEAGDLDNFLESSNVTPLSDRPPVLTEDEMPDDEDSGVIYDNNESPERLPCDPSADQSDDRSTDELLSKGNNSDHAAPEESEIKTTVDNRSAEDPGALEAVDCGPSGSETCGRVTGENVSDVTSSAQTTDQTQDETVTQSLATELETAEQLQSPSESSENVTGTTSVEPSAKPRSTASDSMEL